MTDYTSVKIPKRLAELVQESPRYKEYGYTSVSQFVLEATRWHLEGIIKRQSR